MVGTRNSDYSSWSFGYNNILTNINYGISCNAVIVSQATGQSNWKTSSTIMNNSGYRYFPAVCCCWRFHTAGTSQGDWYLPTVAELGYLCSRQLLINESLSLVTAYQIWDGNYISCEEKNETDSCYVNLSNGYVVCSIDKDGEFSVIAFTRI